MEMKKCSKCGVAKPLTYEYFHKNADTKSGFSSACKECRNKLLKNWREERQEKVSGVYAIINNFSDRIYIGSSVRVSDRWDIHKSLLRRNKHYNKLLQNDWNKFGEKNFLLIMLETCESEKLIEREQYWIDKLSPKYNESPTAGSIKGFKRSEENRIKIADANRRRTKEQNETAARKQYREYTFVSPFGEKVKVVGLKKFCRENSLDPSSMIKVHKGKMKSYKGWTRS